MNVQIEKYRLTTNHPASSYNQPVLVDKNDRAYGPADVVETVDPDLFGGRSERTASMIVANWCKSHMPDDYRQIDQSIITFAHLT